MANPPKRKPVKPFPKAWTPPKSPQRHPKRWPRAKLHGVTEKPTRWGP